MTPTSSRPIGYDSILPLLAVLAAGTDSEERFIHAIRRYDEIRAQVAGEYAKNPGKFFSFWQRSPFQVLTAEMISKERELKIRLESEQRLRRELRRRGVPV